MRAQLLPLLAASSLWLTPALCSPFVYHRRPQFQQYLGPDAQKNPSEPTEPYDYVVVGGGVTGLIAAARLAEFYNVAVIERGGYYETVAGNKSSVPAYDENWDNPPDDLTEHWWEVPPSLETNGRTLNFTSGKMVGGSHDFSYFGYLRPSVGSLQKWADEVDDQSWTYQNTEKYFDKSVFFTPPNSTSRWANATPEYDPSSLQGTGPLELSYPRWAHPFGTWIRKGLDAMGVPHALSFATGELFGSSWVLDLINSTDGTRATTWTAFVKDKPHKKKLDIFTDTLAEKILFDGTTATGVAVTRNQTEHFTIEAKNEVVLAGGAILSPQLLMVSGVGPADELKKWDITPILDSPSVGQHMQDHIVLTVTYKVNVPTTSILQDEEVRQENIALFNNNLTGMLFNPGPDVGLGYDIPKELRNFTREAREDLGSFPKDWPEVIMVTYPMGQSWPNDGNYASLASVPMAVVSRGNVTLTSSQMTDKALVRPGWLTSHTDLEIAVGAVKYMRTIFENPALTELLASDEISPGTEAVTWTEVEDAVRSGYRSMHHAGCTLRMGRKDDPNAVVDSTGKVIGLDNVRVVDVSVFPFLPPALPLATAFMVAEKITDHIITEQQSNGRHDELRLDL
ncbi:GMC family oxidoreductase [Aspergillus ibericus CBS 121593]|uniref:Alcohol oxidase n=1 Tax=Aspergillus ibericus CBS 121593 TaxID=1448316 RepID=A0A395H4S9_9EURO|nr:alcohol oxidase [Aspergillus ibericus CBS 121593]RAL02215.1 alcohol oxidase [Aspergillus ibericus CBS 121593]